MANYTPNAAGGVDIFGIGSRSSTSKKKTTTKSKSTSSAKLGSSNPAMIYSADPLGTNRAANGRVNGVGGPLVSSAQEPAITPFTKTLADYLASVGATSAGSLADYLAQAQGIANNSIANQLADLENRRGTLRQDASQGDARLAALYQALATLTNQNNAGAAEAYQQAQAQSQQVTQDAQAAMDASNASAAARQQAIEQGLGIDVPLADQRSQLEYQQMNTSGNQAIGNAAAQRLIQLGLAQTDLGQSYFQAGQLQGTQSRADLQRALMAALSDIDTNEAQLRDSAASNAYSLAQSMYGSANDAYQQALARAQAMYDADRNAYEWDQQFQAGRDDEAWNRAQSSVSTVDPSKLNSTESALYVMQQAGVDSAVQRYIMQKISEAGGDLKGAQQGTPLFTTFYNAIIADPNLSDEQKRVAFSAGAAAFGGYGK